MNQDRIGKFIAEMRNKKNLTQQELAEKINVTNKAISKWENGRGLPDYSCLNNLCKALDVSINELLSGELNKKEKNDGVGVIEYIGYKEKKHFRNNLIAIIFSILVLVICVLLVYFINSYKKINAYTLNGTSENFTFENGLLVTSNIKTIMHYGNLRTNTIDQKDILSVSLTVKIDDEFYFISSYRNNEIVEEDYGYGEYFSKDKISHIPNDLYLLIFYRKDNGVITEELKINNEKILINDKILNLKMKEGFENNSSTPIDLNKYDNLNTCEASYQEEGFKYGINAFELKCKNCYVKEIKKNELIGFSCFEQDKLYYYYNNDNLLIKSIMFVSGGEGSGVIFRVEDGNTKGTLAYDFYRNIVYAINGNDKLMKYKDNVLRAIELYNKYRR